MKSDLRSLDTADQSFFADSVRYTVAIEEFYTPSTGVTVEVVTVTDSGWAAVAHHTGTTVTCGIFVGPVPSPIARAPESQPRCTPIPR